METISAALSVVASVVSIADVLIKNTSAKDLETKQEQLKAELEKLRAIRVLQEDELKKYSERIKEGYRKWIESVEKVETEVRETINKYEKKKWKFIGRRSELVKKMGINLSRVVSLGEEGLKLGSNLAEKVPEKIVNMKAQDIKEFPTLQGKLEETLCYLTNDEVKGIRIWGSVGTGKTAIMQNLNNHEKVAKIFDLVIWVNVSAEGGKNLSTKLMQQRILRRLKCEVDGASDVSEVASKISNELRNWKYLLLLDDVNEDFELDQIGIDPKNGSKVVLTTTADGVCNKAVDRFIEVGKLTRREARRMFKNVVNGSNQRDELEIERITSQVLDFCVHIPLVINTVANGFKMRNSVQKWWDGLERLRFWPEKQDDSMKELYKVLNFCSSQLKGIQKDCFSYSAIYPEGCDISINCLLDCWEAEDLYKHGDSIFGVKQVRAYFSSILEEIKKFELLEESDCKKNVRMPKMIRRAALHNLLAESNYKHLVKTGQSLEYPPEAKLWEEKKWISLADNELGTLPKSPNCSMLSTLFLQKNPRLRTIPGLFFEHMQELRVLNAGCTEIESLPPSVSKLIHLKVLYLNGCANLVMLPTEIGVLENIEVLDMRGSRVKKIPHEIAKSRLLRRLLVSFPSGDEHGDDEIVSHNCEVISKISKLEELVIDVRSHEQLWKRMQNDVVDKISVVLTKLTTLKFCYGGGIEDDVIKFTNGTPAFSLHSTNALECFLQRSSNFDSFQVFIGCSSSTPPQIPNCGEYERYLRYCNGKSSDDTIRKVLTKTYALELFHLHELEHLSDFGIANLNKVRGCVIGACDQVQAITNNVDCPILPNLEELYVKMMPVLETILKGPIPLGSLCKLRTLKIESCQLIKELLVHSGNTTLHRDFLPNLETLILTDMPCLTKICLYNSLDWPALKKLQIDGCPVLNELPFGKDSARNLESIEVEQIWWDKLNWREPEVNGRLQPLLLPLGNGLIHLPNGNNQP